MFSANGADENLRLRGFQAAGKQPAPRVVKFRGKIIYQVQAASPTFAGEELPLRQAQRTHQELQLPARQRVFHRRTVGTNAEVRLVRAVRGVGQHAVALEASL